MISLAAFLAPRAAQPLVGLHPGLIQPSVSPSFLPSCPGPCVLSCPGFRQEQQQEQQECPSWAGIPPAPQPLPGEPQRHNGPLPQTHTTPATRLSLHPGSFPASQDAKARASKQSPLLAGQLAGLLVLHSACVPGALLSRPKAQVQTVALRVPGPSQEFLACTDTQVHWRVPAWAKPAYGSDHSSSSGNSVSYRPLMAKG